MPRIAPRTLWRAYGIDALLPLLLRECRVLESARAELRWMKEYVREEQTAATEPWQARNSLLRLARRRGRGVPLQYLLGSQPFGELDILCRPGVLIPRPETEAYTIHLAGLVEKDPGFKDVPKLRILDLCTGTGCIPLLLYSLLRPRFSLEVKGVDVSPTALKLAKDNILHNISKANLDPCTSLDVKFVNADVLSGLDNPGLEGPWDIVISNPPYISHAGFSKDTTRSVRNWEPKLALVPPNAVPSAAEPHPEDVFYPAILAKAQMSMAKVVLMEVADSAQALRAAGMARSMGCWKKVEIWRDWPDMEDAEDRLARDSEDGSIEFVGSGHGRSVVCWRWVGGSMTA